MKKKYITPTTRVVALRSQAHLLDYSVDAMRNGDSQNVGDWNEE